MNADPHPLAGFPKASPAAQTRPPLSLKAIIAVLFGALLALGIAGAAVVSEKTLSREAARDVRQDLGDLAVQVRYWLDRGMFERHRDIKVASSLDSIRIGTTEARRRVLEQLQQTYPAYAWIGLVDAEGRVLASTGRLLEGQDVSAREWFQSARLEPYVGDVHPALLLATLLPGEDGRELHLVDIAAPVYDEAGDLQGVLGAHLNWTWADEVVSSFLSLRAPEERIEIFILAADGAVLLGPQGASEQESPFGGLAPGTPGAEIVGSDGRRYAVAVSRSEGYSAYPGLGWQVVVRQPVEVAFARVRDLRKQLLLTGGGLTLAIMGIGWALAGWIGTPLRDIARAAVLARDGSSFSIPPTQRFAEARSLADSLQALVADLQLQQSALRASVKESQRQQRFLGAILSNMTSGVFVEKGGKIVFANEASARLFGVDESEAILGRSAFQFFHEDDHALVAGRIAALGEEKSSLPPVEERIIQPDGTVRTAEVAVATFLDDGDQATLVILHDVTERKSTERQLQRAQRLEAVGQLTGGLAHDFNNLLTVIIGSLDMLEARPLADTKERELVVLALQAALRGADLTHQLLAFSRRQSLEAKPINLNELVAATERMLRRTLGERIQVRLALSEDLWPALADPAQVESALTNLAINARDAMPDGGNLTIATGNRHLDEEYALQNVDITPGDYVMLTVSDTGTGMPPEVLAKAYEPFFTTKAEGKGSGLGLAMIYGFAKQSRGHVRIYSELGYGTTVALYLPQAGERMCEGEHLEEPVRASKSATVLVVDDDPAVRSVAVRQIAELGHNPVEAPDAATALDFLAEGRPVDLLFTDVVMPGAMTGPELALRAWELRPGLKVLFTSGFAEASLLNGGKFAKMRERNLLSKPYRKHDLGRRIAEVLQDAS